MPAIFLSFLLATMKNAVLAITLSYLKIYRTLMSVIADLIKWDEFFNKGTFVSTLLFLLSSSSFVANLLPSMIH